jgi:hypothetical protein
MPLADPEVIEAVVNTLKKVAMAIEMISIAD